MPQLARASIEPTKASTQALSIVDIVQSILEKALLPHFLVNPELCAVPSSMWLRLLRQKVAHIYVSKTWYYAGVPLLYEDVCIQQIDQLPLLARSLTGNQGLLPYLKRLHFFAFLPECYTEQALDHLIQILGSCPNVYSFSVVAPPELPSLSILPPLPTSITHLSLNQEVAHASAVAILASTSPTLQSLTLHGTFGDVPNLSFPRLVSLALIYADGPINSTPWSVLITTRWSFPSLQGLTLQQSVFSSANILAICQNCGSTLTYLSIHPAPYYVAPFHWDLDTEAPDDDDRFIDLYPSLPLLPRLQHLVLYSSITLPSLEDPLEFIPHPKIEWIDVWCGYEWATRLICEPAMGLIRRCSVPGRFPALKGIRAISLGLVDFPSLPQDIPPRPELSLRSGPWERGGTLRKVPDSMQNQSFKFEYLPGFAVWHVPGRIHDVDYKWANPDKECDDSTYRDDRSDDENEDRSSDDDDEYETLDLDTEFGYAFMDALPESFFH